MTPSEPLERFLRHAPAAIAVLDPELRYVAASDAWMAEYAPGEQSVAGRSHYEVFPELRERWQAAHGRCLDGEAVEPVEDPLEPLNGRSRRVRWALRPWKASDGNIEGIILWMEDVSARERAEEALRQSRAHYEFLAAAAHVYAEDDPKTMIAELCRRVREYLDCDLSFNYLADESTGRLRLFSYAGIPAATARAIEWLEYGQAICGSAAAGKCRIVSENIPSNGDPRAQLVRSLGVQAYACHPLLTGNEVLGTMSFASTRRSVFSDGELEIMAAVAGPVAAALVRLREHSALRSIVEAAADAIVTIDAQGVIRSANPAAHRMSGHAAGSLVGRTFEVLVPKRYRNELVEGLCGRRSAARVRDAGNPCEVAVLRADGGEVPVSLSASVPDELGRCTLIARDISERRALQRRVLDIADEESRKFGQELHDHVQQQLTGLGLLARSLADALESQGEPAATTAARLADGIGEAGRDVQLLARGLIPYDLDERGLRASLAQLASRTDSGNGITCRLVAGGAVDAPCRNTALQLYRIAQEAVNNAVKHGGADRIVLELTGSQREVTLTVRDNGVGIDDVHAANGGSGMAIMRYRAQLVGGTLEIGRMDGAGTRIRCTVPVAVDAPTPSTSPRRPAPTLLDAQAPPPEPARREL